MLYRKYKGKRRDNVSLQLMVPQKLRERVLFTAHESLLPSRSQEDTRSNYCCFLLAINVDQCEEPCQELRFVFRKDGKTGSSEGTARAPAVDRRTLPCDLCGYRRTNRTEIEKWL